MTRNDSSKEFKVCEAIIKDGEVVPIYNPVYSFDEFCLKCNGDARKALISFSVNSVGYPNGLLPNNVSIQDPSDINKVAIMQWPDNIIRNKKVGNCVDISIFMHLFFRRFGIKHYIVFSRFIDTIDPRISHLGHCYIIYSDPNRGGSYWIWNYVYSAAADINGPYLNIEHAMRESESFYEILFNTDRASFKNLGRNPRIPLSMAIEDSIIKNSIEKMVNKRMYQKEVVDYLFDIKRKYDMAHPVQKVSNNLYTVSNEEDLPPNIDILLINVANSRILDLAATNLRDMKSIFDKRIRKKLIR